MNSVVGKPKIFLRIEGLVVLAGSIAVFAHQNLAWWMYPLLVLVPDVFMAGYLASTKLGALTYNIGHSYPLAALLVLIGYLNDSNTLLAYGAIWFGHIGFDRMLGYGLKYDDNFKHTHLGTL